MKASPTIRPFVLPDLDRVVQLTIDVFRPYYEGHVRKVFGDELFALHHGRWDQDYRDEVPTLHDPAAGKWIAVADIDGAVAGYVAWKTDQTHRHGQISLLAVAEPYRRRNVARELCDHAMREMTAQGVQKIGVFTGGDAFHAPAQALYESLGFIKIPIVGYLKKV